jgi:DNA repair exonuclease SbcCD ATPase subunit
MNNTTLEPKGNCYWPWDFIEVANKRHDNAKRRELAARINGQLKELEQAIADQFDSLGDRQKLRDQLADLIIGGLRVAFEERPEQLAAVLGVVPILEPRRDDVEELQDAVATLEGRVSQLEHAVATLEAERPEVDHVA